MSRKYQLLIFKRFIKSTTRARFIFHEEPFSIREKKTCSKQDVDEKIVDVQSYELCHIYIWDKVFKNEPMHKELQEITLSIYFILDYLRKEIMDFLFFLIFGLGQNKLISEIYKQFCRNRLIRDLPPRWISFLKLLSDSQPLKFL